MLRAVRQSVGAGFLACALIVAAGMSARPQDDPKAAQNAEERFERLLAEAKKDPGKADWKQVRVAFAETKYYEPYTAEVDEKLREAHKAFTRGEVRDAKIRLLELAEREHYMRVDTVMALVVVYHRLGEDAKADTLDRMLRGLLGAIAYPEDGTSYEDPLRVLFISEEYLITSGMKAKRLGLFHHDGGRFDVWEVEGDVGKPAQKVYFNVDMPQKSLERALRLRDE